MGPRSLDRGNIHRRAAGGLRPTELQWGRDLSIAEISGSFSWQSASLPVQWGRDLSIAEICPHLCGECQALGCSMGPRSLDRGNIRLPAVFRMPSLSFNGAAISRSRKYVFFLTFCLVF